MRTTVASLLTILFCSATSTGQLNGFLDKQSAAPGETVQVYVDNGQQHRIKVLHSPLFDKLEQLDSGILPASPQASFRGSCAIAADAPALKITGPITLEAWVNPSTVPGDFEGILMKYLALSDTAYALFQMPGGQVSFYLSSDGVWNTANRLLSTNPLQPDTWTHVAATWDGTTKRLYIDGVLDTTQPFAGPIYDTDEGVYVGAFNGGPGAPPFSIFNGSIDSPAIHAAALTPAEIATRFAERADYDAGNPGVLPSTVAQWNFQEMEGSTLVDATGNDHDMILVNYASRSVPGPAWTGPAKPTQWCIRFSEQDLYNPPWSPVWSFVVDPAWEPGFYIVEVSNQSGATTDLPFVVKPAPGTEAKIFVLVNTNTWAAYNQTWTNGLYSTHPGGDLNNYAGLLTPNTDALANLHSPGSGQAAHLIDAERYLFGWLLLEGYDFDLYTDLDLHQDPNLLDPYHVFLINAHSEYWSTEQMDHLEAFQDRGGTTLNLSGNTMWTRVTYSQDFTMMEGRKHPRGVRPNVHPPGERWHNTGGQVLGGTLRCVGRPEHELILSGFGILNLVGGVYQAENTSHWVYAGTGAVDGQKFGLTSLNGVSIVGFEADYTDGFWGTPAGTVILARGVDFTAAASDLDISDCQNRIYTTVFQGGDVSYYDHPAGGGIFSMPSVTAGGALPVSPVAAKMVSNVIDRGLEQALRYCTAGTSASGCQATLSATGAASASASTGFTVATASVEGSKDGLYFFGANGRQANSWGSGTSYQCVIPPVSRGGLLTGSGTTGLCDGSFTQDLNALWCPTCPKPFKNPGAGAVVQAQLWYRDPGSTSNQTTSLSDAIEFCVGP
jgi:hypothetical protein